MRPSLVLPVIVGLLVSGCNSTSDVRTVSSTEIDAGHTGKSEVAESTNGEQAGVPATARASTNAPSQSPVGPAGFPRGISVHSTGVKKIGENYRYFFGVYNNTDETFMGRISITYDADAIQGMSLGSDRFTVYANGGGSFYFDWTVAPYYVGVHGEYGVRTLRYELRNAKGELIATRPIPLSTRYSVYP